MFFPSPVFLCKCMKSVTITVCLFFILTRSCSASMLDVVCLDMSDPALTSWVVSTHKLLHILAYVWVLHVRRVCGLIIEMVPQGDVSPTSQTLSFILVVSGALPLSPPPPFLYLTLFPCCLSLFILYVKFVYSYVKVFARHMNRAVGMFTNREDYCESKRKEKWKLCRTTKNVRYS